MRKIYNFSAGPAVLPEEVLEQAREEMLDWHGSGMSVMEMSHRGKEFMSIADKTESALRELAGIPDHYKVLFLQGGASSQFAMVPMNLLGEKGKAEMIVSTRFRPWRSGISRLARLMYIMHPMKPSVESSFSGYPIYLQ